MARLLIVLILGIFMSGCSNQTPLTRTELIFDTPVTISIYDSDDTEILNNAFALCKKYENKFSRTIEDSEVSLLNQANGKEYPVSSELLEILKISKEYSVMTDGLFDVTIYPLSTLWDFKSPTPSIPHLEDIESATAKIDYNNIKLTDKTVTLENSAQIDLGGIAKGYIAAKVRDNLMDAGINKAIISIGGNIVSIGSKDHNHGFIIGIQKPYSEYNDVSASVEVTDMSVVTSGPYERSFELDNVVYHHILDPRTGFPVISDMLSATIISTDPFICDALSTSCFLLGLDGAIELIESLDDTEAVFITNDYKVVATSGIGDDGIPIKYY